uniref:3-dehydroquinate synthase domain-containing protein n=1 Tax=Calcidiscus leptoporus TaxID=127549 RepID=A0A7S0JAN9_9EUKA
MSISRGTSASASKREGFVDDETSHARKVGGDEILPAPSADKACHARQDSGDAISAMPPGFLKALGRAVADIRRVDELVTSFAYDGRIETEADGETIQAWEGQGAVKRFLANLLSEGGYTCLDVLEQTPTTVQIALRGAAPSPRRLLTLALQSRDGLIERATLRELSPPAGSPPLFAPANGGLLSAVGREAARAEPKWETFDGRVRQKIWRQDGVFAPGNAFLKETMALTTGRLIAVVDETVWALYGERLRAWAASVDVELAAVVSPGNEDQKTLATYTFLLDELKRVDPLRRSEPVLAIGGGVLTDTVGFACACWRRGIPWCRLPTTLLGQVDASVGIKVAINYHRKNGVGHFFSPLHTFIDTSFLHTLPLAEVRSGVGEIMKAALIHDVRIWRLIDLHGERLIDERFHGSAEAAQVIKLSIDAMLQCIGPDLWEEALLRPMDFGHSFSRTLEADGRFQLRHGEAVAVDCVMSALIAEQLELLSTSEADALLKLYARLGLPCTIEGCTADTYKRARDEIIVHRDGLLRAPLPAGIGACVYVDEIDDATIEKAYVRLEAFVTAHPSTKWDVSKGFNEVVSRE